MTWYALTVSPRRELTLMGTLKDDDLRDFLEIEDVYCPIETYSVRLKMKRHPIVRARPLTPGYVFVRCRRPYLAMRGLAKDGVTGMLYQAGDFHDRPAPISDNALHEIKMREAEIAMRLTRRKDRSKRKIRAGSEIKVGDRLSIPHLGLDVPNKVEAVVGNYAETSAPNGMRIRRQLADLETAL